MADGGLCISVIIGMIRLAKDTVASQQGTVGWHEYLDIQHDKSSI